MTLYCFKPLKRFLTPMYRLHRTKINLFVSPVPLRCVPLFDPQVPPPRYKPIARDCSICPDRSTLTFHLPDQPIRRRRHKRLLEHPPPQDSLFLTAIDELFWGFCFFFCGCFHPFRFSSFPEPLDHSRLLPPLRNQPTPSEPLFSMVQTRGQTPFRVDRHPAISPSCDRRSPHDHQQNGPGGSPPSQGGTFPIPLTQVPLY